LRGILIDSNALLGVPALQQCGSLCFLFSNLTAGMNQLIKGRHMTPPHKKFLCENRWNHKRARPTCHLGQKTAQKLCCFCTDESQLIQDSTCLEAIFQAGCHLIDADHHNLLLYTQSASFVKSSSSFFTDTFV